MAVKYCQKLLNILTSAIPIGIDIGALKHTGLPVKIVWATEDPVAVKAIALKLHEEILNSELHLLEKTGHYPMLENSSQWVNLILNT